VLFVKVLPMRKKTLVLCGHQSRYGLMHLQPILSSPIFDVRLIVIGSDQRWEQFRIATAPDDFFAQSQSLTEKLKRRAYKLRNFLQRQQCATAVKNVTRIARGIPVKVVDDINDAATIAELRSIGAEVLLSAAFPQIFSRETIESASEASINFHPSALPRCRGAHPHFWSIATGEKFGGVTAHLLAEQLDAGDIVAQRIFRIDHLNYSQLYDRIVAETPALIGEVAAFVSSPQHRAVPQDHSKATYFRNERLMHRRIFWRRQSAEQIENLSRTGAAFCFFQGDRHVIVSEARAISENRNLHGGVDVEPGTIVDAGSGAIIVKSIDQFVEIREVREKGRAMSPHKWMRRRGARIGEQFA